MLAGTSVAYVPAMNKPALRLIHWTLLSSTTAITCDVTMNANRSFEVRVAPAWAPESGAARAFPTAMAAIEYHAELAGELRDSGWRVVEHSRVPSQLAA